MFMFDEINVVGNDWIQAIGPRGRLHIRIADIRTWEWVDNDFNINIGTHVITLKPRPGVSLDEIELFDQELYNATVGRPQ